MNYTDKQAFEHALAIVQTDDKLQRIAGVNYQKIANYKHRLKMGLHIKETTRDAIIKAAGFEQVSTKTWTIKIENHD